MKIGIFGDSFACYHEPAKQFHWSTIIGQKLKADVEIHALGNTSLFYTYNTFLKHYTDYDLNIIAVTEPHRYTKKIELSALPATEVSSFQQIDHLRQVHAFKLSQDDRKLLSNLEGWFIMSDDHYQSVSADLMMSHMESLHSNILLYPCFETSFSDARYHRTGISKKHTLISLLWHQLKLIGSEKGVDMNKEKTSMIAGHLSPEMNEYISRVMYSKILSGKWEYHNIDDIKMKYPAAYYYETI